jgi:hypothetical protein
MLKKRTLEESLRDYGTLGKILSYKLQFDNKAYVPYDWANVKRSIKRRL